MQIISRAPFPVVNKIKIQLYRRELNFNDLNQAVHAHETNLEPIARSDSIMLLLNGDKCSRSKSVQQYFTHAMLFTGKAVWIKTIQESILINKK